MSFNHHLESYEDLITPYEETRAGFIYLALEKNRKATPYVDQAKALKVFASRAKVPQDLLQIPKIKSSLLTAAGISEKAKMYLQEDDEIEAIKGLIKNFLEPAGKLFLDELIYRFLLIKGDSLGGSMRNLAGKLGEWRFTRFFLSTCIVSGISFKYLDSKSKKWMVFNSEPDIEKYVKGLHWIYSGNERTLIYNLTVPVVKNNVDLCLLSCSPNEILSKKKKLFSILSTRKISCFRRD